jgi:serine/threonine protein kinase
MTENPPQSPLGTTPLQASDREELEALRAATLGHYEVLGELGRGGMATVYLAHDIALDRKVAIKVMSPVLSLGDGVERFKREAKTSASLSHPNIIPIYAVRHTERLLYFVMKYVDGRSLDSIIDELRQLPVPMVQAILGQAASAFGYAHRRGVVHRDIKPGNILIDEEGWAIITDFGIAKVSQAPQLTSTGLSVGTPTYMSPEQVGGQGVTGASDQYSLGVVAYEMLTGQPPFTGGGLMATMYAHVHQPPEPVEKLRPDCPEGLRNAVMRMLAKDVGDRWPSIEDIISVIGSPSLTPDDPSRSQLIAIAKTGQRGGLAVSTPKSPIPLLRTPSPLLRASAAGAGASATPAPPPSDGTTGVALAPRRTSAFSLALALGGVLVGVGSIAVALKIRSPAHPRGAETGAAAPLAATPPAASPPAPPSAPVVSGNARPAAPGPAGAASTEPISKPSQPNVGAAQATSAPAAPAGPPAHEQEAVEAAIRSYASALDAGSVEQARRAFPAMADSQQTTMEAFFAAGGRITTLWRVTDVRVDGDRATARIRGASRTEPADSAPAIRAVNLRAVLERTPDGWQLRALGGSGAH